MHWITKLSSLNKSLLKSSLYNCLKYSTQNSLNDPPITDYKFTKDHEWIHQIDPHMVKIGITDTAQKALGDIVYVELSKIGTKVIQKDVIGVVESVKGASDVFSPVNGEITNINPQLESKPSWINKDPYQTGWLCQLKMTNVHELDTLMNLEEYKKYCEEHPSH